MRQAEVNQNDALEKIIELKEKGSSFVFLLGAGISVESGVPPLAGVGEYLAKVKHWAKDWSQPRHVPGTSPAEVLKREGWPDYFEITSQLWRMIDRKTTSLSLIPYRRRLAEILTEAKLDMIKEMDQGAAHELAARKSSQSPKPLNLGTNYWKPLLSHLTRLDQGLIDTLFQRLTHGRAPGIAHQFLSFLVPLLGVRLILTLNFDALLEEALVANGLPFSTFAVNKDFELPSADLLSRSLSLIKLHGSGFSLQIGDTLEMPLSANSSQQIQSYFSGGVVVVVLGLGGYEKRILDLVVQALMNEASQVFWFHFERELPPPIRKLAEDDLGNRLRAVPIESPGSLLVDLHGRLATRHPPCERPYRYRVERPMPYHEETPESLSRSPSLEHDEVEAPVVLFLEDVNTNSFGATLELSRYVSQKRETHQPIWIDLESMHTIAEVVDAAFRQIRQYDHEIPPVSLVEFAAIDHPPADDNYPAEDFEKPVRRLLDALGRGRYIVAFNGVNSFGRMPTSHHWDGEDKRVLRGQERRLLFFVELIYGSALPGKPDRGTSEPASSWLRDSILAFAVDKFPPGNDASDPRAIDFKAVFDGVKQRRGDPAGVQLCHPQLTSQDIEEYLWPADYFLLVASAFRERRSRIALVRLLDRGQYPMAYKSVQEAMQRYRVAKVLVPVEGGDYWMPRWLRNRVYESVRFHLDQVTLKRKLSDARSDRIEEPEIMDLLDRLWSLVVIHRDIGRYYHELFLSCQQLHPLREALYHAISGLRYLTKLDALLGASATAPRLLERTSLKSRLTELVNTDAVSRAAKVQDWRLAIRRFRLSELTRLHRLLHNHQASLRSEWSPTALMNWTALVVEHDLPRFNSSWVDFLRGATQGQSDNSELPELDDRIEREIRALARFLSRLYCETAMSSFLFKDIDDRLTHGLDASVTMIETETDELEATLDRWACRIRMTPGGSVKPDGLEAHITSTTAAILASSRRTPTEIALVARYWRQLAEGELYHENHWASRIADWEREPGNFRKKMDTVIGYCDQGIKFGEDCGGEAGGVQRSLLFSLRGRASFLAADYTSAEVSLDRAADAVHSRAVDDSEALAVRSLRLAEYQMLRSDDLFWGIAGTALRGPQKDVLQDRGRDIGSMTRTIQCTEEQFMTGLRSLLESETHLAEALRKLQTSRRSIELQISYWQLRAQLAVEKCLLGVAWASDRGKSKSKEGERFRPQLAKEVHNALQCVRYGLDLLRPSTLPQMPTRILEGPRRPHTEHLLRNWLETYICFRVLRKLDSNDGVSDGDPWTEWIDLNATAQMRSLTRIEKADLDDSEVEKTLGYRGLRLRFSIIEYLRVCVRRREVINTLVRVISSNQR